MFTVTQLQPKFYINFNSHYVPFKVQCRPTDGSINSFNDYIDLVSSILAEILEACDAYSSSDRDVISFLIKPGNMDTPIITPWVRRNDFNIELVLNAIADVYQSNREFILDEEFKVYGRIIKEPRIGGHAARNIQDAAEARVKLQSIKAIDVKENWCMPAAVLMAKFHADNDKRWRTYRNTKTQSFFNLVKDFAAAVLGRDRNLDDENGATRNDLQLFQNFLGNNYQIKVFDWTRNDPVWKTERNRTKPLPTNKETRFINLMLHRHHFDVITKLGAYFLAKGYCHQCEAPIWKIHQHRCAEKCYGCFRTVKCRPAVANETEIRCFSCNRFFPHQDCFDYHKSQNNQGKSLCDKYYYCGKCNRLVSSLRRKNVKHTCGEIFCQSCRSFVAQDHKCYIKPLRPDGEALRIEPSVDERTFFGDARYCYFDCEAFVEGPDSTHHCNLVVAQYEIKGKVSERVFSGSQSQDDFCSWAISKPHRGWTFVAHNAKKYDNYFVMQYILRTFRGQPEVIVTGGSVMLIKVKALHIRFIDSCNFMQSALAKLPGMFGLQHTVKKGFFPHKFNLPSNYAYRGAMPDISVYEPDNMDPKRRAEFEIWYKQRTDTSYEFNFWKELTEYCRDDVRVLRSCCEQFRKQYFEITTIDPFSYITLASACNAVYRKQFMPANTIGLIPSKGYYGHEKHSFQSIIWLEYVSKQQDMAIQHARNGGEKTIVLNSGKHVKPDGCYEAHLFEFYGYALFFINSINPLFYKLSINLLFY